MSIIHKSKFMMYYTVYTRTLGLKKKKTTENRREYRTKISSIEQKRVKIAISQRLKTHLYTHKSLKETYP